MEIACFPLIDSFLTVVRYTVLDAFSLQKGRQNDLIDGIIYENGKTGLARDPIWPYFDKRIHLLQSEH